MPRKGENIYKRKDGRWEGRYKKGRKETGQIKYGYIYGKKYNEVKEQLYKHKLKYQNLLEIKGEYADTYEDWSIRWLENRKISIKASTYSTYFYKLKRYVFPFIGMIPLNQLNREDIQNLVEHLEKKGLKASTIHVLYQIIKKSFKDAYNQRLIFELPHEGILLPRKIPNQPKALTKSEQQNVENEAKSLPLHKGLPILLALNAGLRIGEISALRWEDIDLINKTIHVKNTVQRIQVLEGEKRTRLSLYSSKTDKSIRTIPMSFTIYKYLKKWKKKSVSPFICSMKQIPAEPRLINYYFYQIRKKYDLLTTHFHHLRHTFATRCIEANSDVATVSRLLGHASAKTTLDIYTDSFMEGRRQVIKQMDHINGVQ